MKKRIIIISYFFTPNLITAVNRALSWFLFFPKYDIYPIILTRGEKDNFGIEKTKKGEIHRINAAEIYNRRIVKKKLPSFLKLLLFKIYSYTIGISKYDKTYKDFNTYFQKHLANDCDLVLITGGPFILFRVGYQFTKQTNKKWIADYRDMWHLSDLPGSSKNIFGLKVEKKWINTAYKISVVTEHYIKKLKNITNVSVSTIENGFFHTDVNNLKTEKNKKLTFVYPGTLYKSQRIDLTIQAIDEACKLEDYQAQILFIGTQLHKELKTYISNWDSAYLKIKISPKIPKKEAIILQNNCHIGIMCSYGVKGNPSSKLYEFLGMKQPVLLYPSDNDIIEERLENSGLGYSYTTHKEAVAGIRSIIKYYIKYNTIDTKINETYINKYSRETLASLYNELMLKDI